MTEGYYVQCDDGYTPGFSLPTVVMNCEKSANSSTLCRKAFGSSSSQCVAAAGWGLGSGSSKIDLMPRPTFRAQRWLFDVPEIIAC